VIRSRLLYRYLRAQGLLLRPMPRAFLPLHQQQHLRRRQALYKLARPFKPGAGAFRTPWGKRALIAPRRQNVIRPV
jgi:hypothetical protein